MNLTCCVEQETAVYNDRMYGCTRSIDTAVYNDRMYGCTRSIDTAVYNDRMYECTRSHSLITFSHVTYSYLLTKLFTLYISYSLPSPHCI